MAKKTYLLDGLCCPNCAAKIQTETGRLQGVNHSSVDFPNKRLVLEFEGDESGLLSNVAAVAQKIDEDIVVKAC